VADYFLLSKHIDANLFLVRCGYTKNRLLSELSDIHKTNKINNVFIVLNDVNSASGGYYGGYGYGYGYGYGDYFEKDKHPLIQKLKNLFSSFTNKA
jgi:hypothetical protein